MKIKINFPLSFLSFLWWGVGTYLNSVTLTQLSDHGLGGHTVPVVVDVILVVKSPDLLSVLPDRHQDLLHILSADCDGEHVTT